MKRNYRVEIRGRSKFFETLDAAKAFCSIVFERTGIILGIIECKRGAK